MSTTNQTTTTGTRAAHEARIAAAVVVGGRRYAASYRPHVDGVGGFCRVRPYPRPEVADAVFLALDAALVAVEVRIERGEADAADRASAAWEADVAAGADPADEAHANAGLAPRRQSAAPEARIATAIDESVREDRIVTIEARGDADLAALVSALWVECDDHDDAGTAWGEREDGAAWRVRIATEVRS